MTTYQFKTSMKCEGCKTTAAPALNKVAGEGNWNVDLATPDKVLTVTTAHATPNDVVSALKTAGFEATPIVQP